MKLILLTFFSLLSIKLFAYDCPITSSTQSEVHSLVSDLKSITQEELDEELRKAARWGKFQDFISLIEQGANPHSFNLSGQSAFDIAIRWSAGNEAQVKLKNKDPGYKNSLDAQLAIIQLLVEKKVSFEGKNYDFSEKLKEYNPETMTIENAYKIAANQNSSKAADYLFSKKFKGFKDSHIEKAAIAGSIEFIQVAIKYHPEKEKEFKDICQSALPVLKDDPIAIKEMKIFLQN